MSMVQAETRMSGLGGLMRALEVDTRMLGMIAALAIMWVGFDVYSDGAFLTARNLWNLAVQTSVVGIVATGMVLVIVTRNIDLSVGSVLGALGMIMAVVQVEVLPRTLGIELGHPAIWIVAILSGVLVGALIGALQGSWIAYFSVPAFIVTLGGLLIFRGVAWWITEGRTVAPMDTTFQIFGGGISGSIGETWSWIVGAVAVVAILFAATARRRSRQRHGFPQKPVWAEVVTVGSLVAASLGAVAVMNAYDLPQRTVATAIVEQVRADPATAEAQIAAWPDEAKALAPDIEDARQRRQLIRALQNWDGLPTVPRGIPVPVLILIAVAVFMSFLAGRTQFGRYVFAIGGNPEAANLAGINTKRIILLIFVLMGVLCAIAAVVQTARLNAGANSTGTLLELSAIAAAVIGGTSLGGGVGTIAGALLGALVMQSLANGMGLLDVDTPLRQVAIGIVLIIAVYLDSIYQRRRK